LNKIKATVASTQCIDNRSRLTYCATSCHGMLSLAGNLPINSDTNKKNKVANIRA